MFLFLPLFFGFELTEDVVLYVALHRARFLLGNESTLSTRKEICDEKMTPNKKSIAKVTSRHRGKTKLTSSEIDQVEEAAKI